MMDSVQSCKQMFSSCVLAAASNNPDIFVVCSDSRGSASMDAFATTLPNQFVEAGIAEQDAVGMAAGISSFGKTVFVCGPACFYSARSFEQAKVDVAYANSDVKIVGISGGVSYGVLGSTHHALHDLASMRALPNFEIFLPCDNLATAAVTEYLVSSGKPGYLRLGRDPVKSVYSNTRPYHFAPGKAELLREGHDCTLIAAGEMVQSCLEAAETLYQKGIEARILDFCSIKPIDEEAIIAAAEETGLIITVEEHSTFGGLGSAVSQVVVENKPVPMRILGFPDQWLVCGTAQQLKSYYKLDSDAIAKSVLEFVSRIGKRS